MKIENLMILCFNAILLLKTDVKRLSLPYASNETNETKLSVYENL